MDAPLTSSSEPNSHPLSIKKPLVILALPFILLFPTLWLFGTYIPEHSAIAKKIGVDHMRVHWGIFWMLGFFSLSTLCFLVSTVMFARRARRSMAARVALIPAAVFALGVLIILVLIFSGA